MAELNRLNDLKEIVDPIVKNPKIEQLLANLTCLPLIERALPKRANPRRERLDPMLANSNMDKALPMRLNWRIDMQEPKVKNWITDNFVNDPIRVNPTTETELPKRL
jgi:hypothetical protein